MFYPVLLSLSFTASPPSSFFFSIADPLYVDHSIDRNGTP